VSIQEGKVLSISITFLDSVLSRFWLFFDTFVIGLLLAALRIGLALGWQPGFFSFTTVVTIIQTLIITSLLSPLAIFLFPLGLGTYLPDDFMPKWLVLSVWTFYLGTSSLGIIVKWRGFVLVMYAVFVIVLILNIAGCGPVVLEALAGRD
jgi:hypothetical protein